MTDHGTHETEKLLLLNSFAHSIGFKDEELPYKDISAPKASPDAPDEYMGFSYAVPPVEGQTDVSNPTDSLTQYETVLDDEAAIENA